MWTKAEEVPKEEADEILGRWDQTEPAMQRMIMLQFALDVKRLEANARTEADIAARELADIICRDHQNILTFPARCAEKVYRAAIRAEG